jgi:CheY-like chemotaxis protein
MDGCTATKHIRAHDKDVVIVGLTAEDAQERCFDAGMNAYYQKPVLAQQLQQIVQQFLQHQPL